MARIIQRHWRTMLLQMILLGVVVVIALRQTSRLKRNVDAAVAPQPVTSSESGSGSNAPSPKTYSRVQRLRQLLALTSRDLAAAGCSQAQATSVLNALLTWTMANEASWDQQEASVRSAHQALDEATRKMNLGPSDSTAISAFPSLQQSAVAADQQISEFLGSASDTAVVSLSSSQQATIATAKTNVGLGVPDDYRYVQNLTSDQAAAIKLAIYKSERMGTTMPPGISLSGLAQVESSIEQNFLGVCAAEAAVLPASNP